MRENQELKQIIKDMSLDMENLSKHIKDKGIDGFLKDIK